MRLEVTCVLGLCQALALPLALAGCDTAQGSEGAGGSSGAGGRPLDAGLDPDAKLEDCISKEGVRICGTEAGCFEDGDDCDCATPVPAAGVCFDAFDIIPIRLCGVCYDGEVCAELPTLPLCVPEHLGRMLWERGGRVTYADGSPYTGEPLPAPTECPEPIGEITLCGGNCGGCGPERFCTGRSPTHPYGICQDHGFLGCSGGDCLTSGGACLRLTTDDSGPLQVYPSICVNVEDCVLYKASIPGGVLCD